jgi:nitroimidazol reductase NimA-like FMN-containing flavoprotein (pyridoxamine 5'-phosphate oxidase superfamily)
MSPEERDAFLAGQRTCRLATGGEAGPHLTALWFVWDGTSVWLNSIVASQRWADIERDNRVSVLVDAGEDFMELQGVEIRGRAHPVGEVPRTGEHNEALVDPEHRFGEKYANGAFSHDGRHAWLQVVPEKIVSWDFTKMALA